MEIALPVTVGTLSGVSLWLATGSFAARGSRAAVRRGDAFGSFATPASAIGRYLPPSLTGAVPVRRLLDELARSRIFAHLHLAEFSREALGGTLMLLCAASGALVGVLSMSPLGVLAGLALPVIALSLASAGRVRNDRQRIETAMPEAFNALSMSLASGHSLAQGMRFVGSHAEEPVRAEFLQVAAAISCGVPASSALDAMLSRLDAPGLDLVALALKVSQRTGAPLKDLLAEASGMVGERIELRRRLDVKTSQARMSAQLVAAMPLALILVLALLSSDFRHGLTTAAGAASIAVALALNAIAWMFIKKIMKVEL